MSIQRDPVSDWYRNLGQSIEDHRGQPLPSNNSTFGRSVFGFLSQTFGGMIPRVPTVGGMSIGLGPDIGDQLKRQGVGLATNAIFDAIFGRGGPYNKPDFNRKLEDKGFLMFEFDADQDISFKIPFFENPKISESREARYVSSEIMNRNEPWRLWTGASPRKVKVDFSITKPNVQSFIHGAIENASTDLQFALRGGKMLEQDVTMLEQDREDWNIMIANDAHAEGAPELNNPWDVGVMGQGVSPRPAFPPTGNAEIAATKYQDVFSQAAVHDTLWLHIMNSLQSVKAGVVRSNSNEILNGPPEIRLKFGSLYPGTEKYILKSYNIRYDEKAGYENTKQGLLPRKLDLSLSLESFSQGISEKDSIINPPGWDTILVIK